MRRFFAVAKYTCREGVNADSDNIAYSMEKERPSLHSWELMVARITKLRLNIYETDMVMISRRDSTISHHMGHRNLKALGDEEI